MKEIKFRFWDKNEKIFVQRPGNVVMLGDGKIFNDWREFEDYVESESLIIMQYTGLKDMNGKEVYEGDMVLDHSWLYPREEDAIIVSWDEKKCGFVPFNFYNSRLDVYKAEECLYNYEVIGNIYENPELWKKDNE